MPCLYRFGEFSQTGIVTLYGQPVTIRARYDPGVPELSVVVPVLPEREYEIKRLLGLYARQTQVTQLGRHSVRFMAVSHALNSIPIRYYRVEQFPYDALLEQESATRSLMLFYADVESMNAYLNISEYLIRYQEQEDRSALRHDYDTSKLCLEEITGRSIIRDESLRIISLIRLEFTSALMATPIKQPRTPVVSSMTARASRYALFRFLAGSPVRRRFCQSQMTYYESNNILPVSTHMYTKRKLLNGNYHVTIKNNWVKQIVQHRSSTLSLITRDANGSRLFEHLLSRNTQEEKQKNNVFLINPNYYWTPDQVSFDDSRRSAYIIEFSLDTVGLPKLREKVERSASLRGNVLKINPPMVIKGNKVGLMLDTTTNRSLVKEYSLNLPVGIVPPTLSNPYCLQYCMLIHYGGVSYSNLRFDIIDAELVDFLARLSLQIFPRTGVG